MNKHFTFSDRVKLEYMIETNSSSSAASIAKQLNKTRGAIYYELKHNTTKLITLNQRFNHTIESSLCVNLSKFPFCCNGCAKTKCSHRCLNYNAYDAQNIAHKKLVSSRVDTDHRKHMISLLNTHLSPHIKSGKSIQVSRLACPSMDVSESTIRRYINNGLLEAKRIDLPNAVRFKPKKEYNYSRSKINARTLYNRTYDDFKLFLQTHPDARVVQLDSVIGKADDRFALLTIFFINSKLQLAFKYNRRRPSINELLLSLYDSALQAGYKLFDVILTDNGSEFQKLPSIEFTPDGFLRFNVFYCDPYRSYQKAECERNHGLIRRVLRKGKSLDLIPQFEFDRLMSHINSYPRGSLNYHTPYLLFQQEFNHIILHNFNLHKIPLSELVLK